jgi:hypothetical protein
MNVYVTAVGNYIYSEDRMGLFWNDLGPEDRVGLFWNDLGPVDRVGLFWNDLGPEDHRRNIPYLENCKKSIIRADW